MNRFLLGGLAGLLLLSGGFFIWQSYSAVPDPAVDAVPPPAEIPAIAADAFGTPPPEPPQARAATREERRFQRYDRNRDGTVTRVEMMSTRTAAFRRLDSDGNNLLSFEEWAVATGDRFSGADGDGSGGLNAAEFATTAPKRSAASRCRC